MRMRTWSRGMASASAASAVVIATRPWAIRSSSRSSVRAATTLTSTQWHADSFVKRNVDVSILRVRDRFACRNLANQRSAERNDSNVICAYDTAVKCDEVRSHRVRYDLDG